MSDTYGVVGGASDAPGLPQVSLPSLGPQPPRPRPRVDVPVPMHPDGAAALLPDYAPTKKAEQPAEGAASHLPEYAPAGAAPEEMPAQQTSVTGAQVEGLKNALTFGTAPAISGLGAASGIEAPDMTKPSEGAFDAPVAAAKYFGRPFIGAAKMLINSVSSHPDPAVKAAYDRGRQEALDNQNLHQEEHPAAFLTGQLAGGLMGPAFGAMGKAATVGGRILKGAIAGGTGGALYGGGTAIGEGEGVPGVVEQGAKGGVMGGLLGGALGGAFGGRVVNPNTPGQRAAKTAADIGAPLPKGLASDSPFVQATAQQASQIPLVGSRISKRAGKTVTAVGEKVNELATNLAPGQNRSIADMIVRPALQKIVDANKRTADVAYGNVRASIDQTKRFTMPRTRRMLDQIKADRAAAGHVNPGQGLEQFENVANGSTFNGAHRARVDAREAGNALVPNPGYNAGDYNRLTAMMTLDLRNIVQAAAFGGRGNSARALKAFEEAEKEFGRLAEQNKLLSQLINARGEGAIASILGAAREKGGNLKLLGQLRAGMSPREFETISGTLLHELGAAPASGEFSLNRFVTGWNKLSDGAKNVMFSPAHRQMIEDFVQLGEHLKDADKYRNTSNTAGAIILWDVIRAAAETGIAAGAGLINPMAAAGVVAGGVTAETLTRYLASPAGAAAIGTWTRAFQDITAGTFTAAKQAAFVMATRNLANTLGVPIDKVADIIRQSMPSGNPPQ